MRGTADRELLIRRSTEKRLLPAGCLLGPQPLPDGETKNNEQDTKKAQWMGTAISQGWSFVELEPAPAVSE